MSNKVHFVVQVFCLLFYGKVSLLGFEDPTKKNVLVSGVLSPLNVTLWPNKAAGNFAVLIYVLSGMGLASRDGDVDTF